MRRLVDYVVIISSLSIAVWVMFSTFSYNSSTQEILLATRLWSDFGAHIPLIRSFSFGSNWPPEYPLFPGEPIRYHFLFYAIVGLLERVGIRIDIALNTLSSIGFAGLLLGVYFLGKTLFNSRFTGVLAIILILFNGSLSFIQFFNKFPVSSHTLTDILQLNNFPSFGPWDGSLVTAFWSLNIYTNQRHFAPAISLLLLFILTLYKYKSNVHKQPRIALLVTITTLIGSTLLFLNMAVAFSLAIISISLLIFLPSSRKPLFLAAIASIPAILLLSILTNNSGQPVIELGYLTSDPVTLRSFVIFWVHNLGLHLLFIPIGMFLAPRATRVLILPLALLFVIPNLIRFSPDMINNHKFFNVAMVLGSLFSAYTIRTLVTNVYRPQQMHRLILSVVVLLIMLFPLTFSGMLDAMVIKNDHYINLSDAPANSQVQLFLTHTKPSDVILNSNWFYHPASLAGRDIYNGYPFFTWSAGYDTTAREKITIAIYQAPTINHACSLLIQENITHVELSPQIENFLEPRATFWQLLPMSAYDEETGMSLYEVNNICSDF